LAGFYGIFLIIALVLVSGVIAYVGDIVGRRMGRKRLSLFGLRPRHTAIVISVVSGMLITIFTLGAALLINENVRVGFLSVDRLRAELKQLRPEHGRLKKEIEALTARGKELEQEREEADAEIARQRGELGKTKKLLARAGEDLKQASGSLKREQVKLGEARAAETRAKGAARREQQRVQELQAESRRLQAQVRDVRLKAGAALAQASLTPPVLEVGQPLDMMLIESGLTLPQIRKRLEGAVVRVDKAVREVGARPGGDGKLAVMIWHTYVEDPRTEKIAWVPNDLVLDGLARDIREKKDPEGVVVRVICLMNTPEGEPAPIDFQIFRNNLVFSRGEKLGEVVVGEGLPDADVYDALVLVLREQVGPRGRGRVMPLMKPGSLSEYSRGREYVGDIRNRDLFTAMEKIKQIRGRAHVTAVAKEDIWTIGPLRVEWQVEPI
jgi:uncharacterized protein YlxW (UPF0749 family)